MRIAPEFRISNPIKPGENEKKKNSTLGFGDLLKESLQDVNELQLHAEHLDQKLALGTLENVHEATIAAEKAALAIELTAQVRNKVLEAYQEIMRTPL